MLLKTFVHRSSLLLVAMLAGSPLASRGRAQSPSTGAQPIPPSSASTYRASRLPARAQLYFQGFWGVDSLAVKVAESGEVVKFSYRVVDADKAKPLNDRKSEPSLEDPQAGVKLVVPSIEQIGQLRQSSTPIVGKTYWMAFSNAGRRVKRGDQVNIVIGHFRANALLVN